MKNRIRRLIILSLIFFILSFSYVDTITTLCYAQTNKENDEFNEDDIRSLLMNRYESKISQHIGGGVTLFIAFFAFRKDNYFLSQLSEGWQQLIIHIIFWLLILLLAFIFLRMNYWVIRINIITTEVLKYDNINQNLSAIAKVSQASFNILKDPSYRQVLRRRELAYLFSNSFPWIIYCIIFPIPFGLLSRALSRRARV